MLDSMHFDEQSKKAMTTAYEVVLVELGLTDRTDPIAIAVASKIISLRQTEAYDADRLIELTLREFRHQKRRPRCRLMPGTGAATWKVKLFSDGVHQMLVDGERFRGIWMKSGGRCDRPRSSGSGAPPWQCRQRSHRIRLVIAASGCRSTHSRSTAATCGSPGSRPTASDSRR